jgi:hypothetical protein
VTPACRARTAKRRLRSVSIRGASLSRTWDQDCPATVTQRSEGRNSLTDCTTHRVRARVPDPSGKRPGARTAPKLRRGEGDPGGVWPGFTQPGYTPPRAAQGVSGSGVARGGSVAKQLGHTPPWPHSPRPRRPPSPFRRPNRPHFTSFQPTVGIAASARAKGVKPCSSQGYGVFRWTGLPPSARMITS